MLRIFHAEMISNYFKSFHNDVNFDSYLIYVHFSKLFIFFQNASTFTSDDSDDYDKLIYSLIILFNCETYKSNVVSYDNNCRMLGSITS